MVKNKAVLRGNQAILEALIPLTIEFNNLLEEVRLLVAAGSSDSGRVRRSGKPQIKLMFSADPDGSPYMAHDSEISFRLMNLTATTITQQGLLALANRINTLFAKPNRFIWQKGRNLFSYSDWEKGYQLQILCKEKAEGRRIVEQVLDVQGHSPQWEYANYIINESPNERYPKVPGKEVILGKSQSREEERPEVKVTFRYAIAKINKRTKVVLVDTTGKLGNALVS